MGKLSRVRGAQGLRKRRVVSFRCDATLDLRVKIHAALLKVPASALREHLWEVGLANAARQSGPGGEGGDQAFDALRAHLVNEHLAKKKPRPDSER